MSESIRSNFVCIVCWRRLIGLPGLCPNCQEGKQVEYEAQDGEFCWIDDNMWWRRVLA